MDAHVRSLARSQAGLLARWQLVAAGFAQAQVDARVWRHRWVAVFAGVYALVDAPLTQRQRWLAACLTAPGTMLAGPSAAACHGFVSRDPAVISVVRIGSGGPRHLDGIRVNRWKVAGADIDWDKEIPITSAERTLIDLAPHLSFKALGRATREAIRLNCLTADSLLHALARHRGARGTKRLRELALTYSSLPIARARSDAESYALERLFRAGIPIPDLNVKVGGVEADLVDHDRKRIVEIDGGQFHMFPDADAAKEAAWKAAGYDVVRLPSDAIYR